MTDAEIDALAQEILSCVLEDLATSTPGDFFQVIETENGEKGVLFSGLTQTTYGAFSCQYWPTEPAIKIVAYCDGLYADFMTLFTKADPLELAKTRPVAVRAMADCAILHLIVSFPERLRHLLEDAVDDSFLVAAGMMAATTAKYLSKDAPDQFTVDARAEIEKAVERSAEKRRVLLREHIGALPNLVAKRGRGAPTKSQFARERERNAYIARIEVAYRKLREKKGKRPTKVSVADELGEGGINRKTGSDTRTNTFNLKLKRLAIDYKEITNILEDELHSNS